jgi:transposase
MPSAAALPVAPDDLTSLRHWASATQAPAVLVQRAKLLLLAAEGVTNTEIAERLGISRPTVITWRRRYVREGLSGRLADRPRRGRPQTVRRSRRAERHCCMCCERALSRQTVVMRTRRPRSATVPRSAFAGFCFPPEVIVLAV